MNVENINNCNTKQEWITKGKMKAVDLLQRKGNWTKERNDSALIPKVESVLRVKQIPSPPKYQVNWNGKKNTNQKLIWK